MTGTLERDTYSYVVVSCKKSFNSSDTPENNSVFHIKYIIADTNDFVCTEHVKFIRVTHRIIYFELRKRVRSHYGSSFLHNQFVWRTVSLLAQLGLRFFIEQICFHPVVLRKNN